MPSGTLTPSNSNVESRATGSELPQPVQKAVPTCAYSCLTAYVQQEFRCSSDDYDCLCSGYTSGGLTLGELAFICTNVGCNGQEASNDVLASAYRVCSSDSEAARPTHNTLTPPPLRPTTSAFESTPTSPTQITTTLRTSTTKASSQTSLSVAQPETTTIFTPSAATSTNTASTAPVASGSHSNLTSTQAVGVSIGAFGAVVIAIGLVYFFAFYRRRKALKDKKEKRHSYDFVDDAPHRFSPLNYGLADSRGPPNGFGTPRFELSADKRSRSLRSLRLLSGHDQEKEKNGDREPRVQRSFTPESHCSDCSERTTSALLPAKPGRFPVKQQLNSPHLANVNTPATVFEEEFRSPPTPARIIAGLPSHPAAAKAAIAQQKPYLSRQPQYMDEYTMSPEPMRQPQLSLEIPRRPTRSDSIVPMGTFPVPPPAVAKPWERRDSSSTPRRDSSSSNDVLSYYASPESGREEPRSATPIDEHAQVRRPAPAAITVTKPTYPPRAVRGSAISDVSNRTSFESNNLDEPTPPEEVEKEVKGLSPVTESPISNIRYPKIPRSSAQIIPRSPVYKTVSSPNPSSPPSYPQRMPPSYRNYSPATPDRHAPVTTLAARRKGEDAAAGLPYPSYRNEQNNSPLQGYGDRSSERNTPNWPLRVQTRPDEQPMQSPGWIEPSKLTPRREGEDMYLAVSVATPMHDRFRT